jgi:hypothetical protein
VVRVADADGWYASLADRRSFRWAVRVVVGWYLSSIGSTRGRRGKIEPRLLSWFAISAPIFYGDGGVGGQCKEMGGGIVENEHDFHRVRFRDALAGPPTSCVPPGVLPLIAFHRA